MADNDDVVFVPPVLTVSRNTEWFGKPLGATVKTDLNIRLYLINLCSCIVTRAGHPFVYKSIGRSLSNPGDRKPCISNLFELGCTFGCRGEVS